MFPIRMSVAIIGAGSMGFGLAVHFALQDRDPILVDHRESNIDWATDQIADAVTFLNEQGMTNRSVEDVLDQVTFTTDRAAGVDSVSVVIESITEDLEAKQDLFVSLVDEVPETTVLASNTSGVPISDIAKAVPDHAERVVGCHWWFPPYLLTPVEVIRGKETDDEYYNRLVDFVESVNRDPIRVQKDVPGFVWNRVQYAVIRECIHLVESGVASVEDVNRAIRDGYATRTAVIGPLETVDITGLDLVHTIAEDLYPHLNADTEPNDALVERVEDGRTGIEAGEGFLTYDHSPRAITRRRDRNIAAIRRALKDADRG